MQAQAIMNDKSQGINKGWLFVVLTCIGELAWVYGFHTATQIWHFALIIALIVLDFYFLYRACQSIPTGTVYALFAAAGTAGAALMDLFLFGGSFNIAKVFFMIVLIIGVVMLKLADGKADAPAKS
ncbi:SMR family transporter [Paenibacillus pasadenensis]|uniref:DMT family transporter n=1 Tax=Paenibacillus pasadenensis TaxID=217090 RepID=UPI00203E9467|nr:SMR family transporter [Paenibacillus pasadenensis]MCM3748198.1 SMR family transporter [Paenibacillus pasadenensis]